MFKTGPKNIIFQFIFFIYVFNSKTTVEKKEKKGNKGKRELVSYQKKKMENSYHFFRIFYLHVSEILSKNQWSRLFLPPLLLLHRKTCGQEANFRWISSRMICWQLLRLIAQAGGPGRPRGPISPSGPGGPCRPGTPFTPGGPSQKKIRA